MERERVNNGSDGCSYWDQLHLYHPPDDQTRITRLARCVFARMLHAWGSHGITSSHGSPP